MKLITDLTKSKLKFLVYGNAGTGKTRFVSTAALHPATSPALMLTIGGNPISILDYPQKPDIIEIESMRDFNDIYDWLYSGQPVEHPLAKALSHTLIYGPDKFWEPYKTLIIDGGSEVNNKVWRMIMDRSESDPDFSPQKASEIDPRKFQSNLATMAEWAGLFFGLADDGNKLPVHVLMTALEREPAIDFRSSKAKAEGVKGPTERSLMARPSFIGQAMSAIESYAYVVGRMVPVVHFDPGEQKKLGVYKVPDTYNIMLVNPYDEYLAKDQYGKLGKYVVDPTMDKVWSLLYGNGKEG